MRGLVPVSGGRADLLPEETVYRHVTRLRRTEVTITYAVSETEDRRRRGCGLEALTGDFLFAGLMEVSPADLTRVPDRFLPLMKKTWRDERLVTAIWDVDGAPWVRREIGVPLRVLDVEFTAPTWAAGLTAAHRWFNCARRTVHLPQLPREQRFLAATEAAYYGVGLHVGDSSGDEAVLNEPDAFHPAVFDAAAWALAEQVYAEYRQERPDAPSRS